MENGKLNNPQRKALESLVRDTFGKKVENQKRLYEDSYDTVITLKSRFSSLSHCRYTPPTITQRLTTAEQRT